MVAPTIRTDLKIERRPLADLKPWEGNPRTIGKRERTGLRESLLEFGLVELIVWNRRSGRVVGGHQRLSVLVEAGVTEVDVVVVDLDEAREKALNVALNNPQLQGRFTDDVRALLQGLGRELPELSERLLLPELDRSLDRILGRSEPEALDDPPPPPLLKSPVTKPGDLWTLGRHRLLCADSTNADHVARLMNGERATLAASDPPYLVDYDGGNHPQSYSNRPAVKDKGWDDYKDPQSGVAFFEGYLRAALAHCRPGVAIYQWHAHRRQNLVDEAWTKVGLLRHQQIIWVKKHAVLTRSLFMWRHEPCLFGWVEGTPPLRRPPPNETTIWEIDQRDGVEVDHPTVKPIEIFARPIRFHTVRGEICLESFSGSGTQIIAAEQLDRRCFAMEIAPAYVDCAVERWEQLTGKKAKRETR